jgi:short-subunit dehydrogenase
MGKIDGKRVLITGASSGIGKAIAFECAARGAVLALTARRFHYLEKAGYEIRSVFSDTTAPLLIPCDVSKSDDVSELIDTCVRKLGGIDILINNAGIGIYGSIEKASLEDAFSVMNVNFFGAVCCTLNVLPIMKKGGGGKIVNISSVAALHGVPYLGIYSASKAALASFGQSLRAEAARSGIDIMVVYPGYTQTEFFQKEKNVGGGHRPSGPFTSPQRVARAVVKAVEKDRRELILSLEGKALNFFRVLLPGLVEMKMQRIAAKLKDVPEGINEQAKTSNHRSLSESWR